jgi:membrane protein
MADGQEQAGAAGAIPPSIPAPPPCLEGKDTAPPQAAHEPSRGRGAVTPGHIPVRGWADILWRTVEAVIADRLLSVAAGVAFFTLLATFPAIAALVSLYGLFADTATIAEHLETLSFFLPPAGVEIVGEQAARVAAKSGSTLGLAFVFSILLALWSANAAMKAMFEALGIVYGEREKRSIVAFNLQTLLFTLGAIVVAGLAIGALVVLPLVLGLLGVAATAERTIQLLRWPILLVLQLGALALLYRFGPSRREARWRWVTVGSVVAALGWVVTSLAFTWYLSALSSFSETYGSLAAVIAFLIWLWLTIFVVLLGGEINAEAERQTVRDTTTGPEKPIGRRGAVVADTIGPAKVGK